MRKTAYFSSFAAIAAVALLFGCQDATGPADAPQPTAAAADVQLTRNAHAGSSDPHVPGRVLVRFEPGANANALAAAHGATVRGGVTLGIKMLSVSAGRELVVARALERNPNVRFAEPDYIRTFEVLVAPADPFFGFKWDLHNDGTLNNAAGDQVATTGAVDADMDWLEAENQLGEVTGSAVIGMIDTGILHEHEDLQGKVLADYDFYAGDSDASDDNGHGTHTAGIAAAYANNNTGVAGVAYGDNIKLVIAKVCGQSNPGPYGYGCPISAIAEGITWAVDNGANTLNISLGGSSGSESVRTALQYARSHDVLPFCSAGNSSGAVSYPAAWPECIAVSATDWSDNLASYSNFGPEVVLAAPGGDTEHPDGYSYILSTYGTGPTDYAFLAGTSMASPQAAGLAALLHALGVSDDQAKLDIMTSTADDLGPAGRDDSFGFGRINVAAAVSAIAGGGDDGTTNTAPSSDFTFTCTDLACDFADASTDSDGSIASWSWDFGDGATSTAQNPSHTYASEGTFTVTLTVTDDGGATDASSRDVTVTSTSNSAPTASFTESCTDLACEFDGSGSSDSDGSIASYAWDFGDGTTGSGQTVSHTFGAEGTYTVTLTVTDDGGATDASSQEVTVTSSSDGGGITLSANGYKVRGRHTIDLTWDGATSTSVDVYINGAVLTTTANDGAYTHATSNRGKGSYTYQVCEAGTATCSNEATVEF